MDKKRLIIIDGNAVVHRAFHALPPLKTKKGEIVNAIYGFLLVFFRAVKELKPEFIVAAFDFPAPSFRHQKYELYKATRKKAPEELYQQIPKTKEVLKSFGVQVLEKQGYEADDIIGTVAKTVSQNNDIESIIISGDLDTLQAIDKNTKVYALRKGVKDIVLYDEQAVRAKYDGLSPENIVDFKALRGDPSDNIPGVFGVGEKTAIALLKDFGSLNNLYLAIEGQLPEAQKIKETLRKKLIDHKEKALLSRELAQLDYKVPVDFDLEKCRWPGYDKDRYSKILESYEFYSLAARLKGENGGDAPSRVKAENAPGKKKAGKENLSIWKD